MANLRIKLLILLAIRLSMKIFLVSNMFPSKKDKLFGIFVKNFKLEMENNDVVFTKTSLIKGRAKNPLKKILNYIIHYIQISLHFVSKKSFDIIYIHFITHHLPILFILLPFKSKKWVLNAHGDDIIGLQNYKFLNFIAERVVKKIDLLIVPTSYFKDKVLSNYSFLDSSNVFVSPSGGIDSSYFYPIKNVNKENMLHLGFVSRFIEEKGWKTFLDALKKLNDNNIPFKASIAGKGPDENLIKEYIKDKKLSQVDFLGFISQDKLVQLYNMFDLYIFPTYREGESLGLTGVEAMSCSTPVVACNMAGPSTYIEHRVNGYMFEPKNSDELVKCISCYIKLSKKEQEVIKTNAYETSKAYEKSIVAKDLIKRLELMLEKV